MSHRISREEARILLKEKTLATGCWSIARWDDAGQGMVETSCPVLTLGMARGLHAYQPHELQSALDASDVQIFNFTTWWDSRHGRGMETVVEPTEYNLERVLDELERTGVIDA